MKRMVTRLEVTYEQALGLFLGVGRTGNPEESVKSLVVINCIFGAQSNWVLGRKLVGGAW